MRLDPTRASAMVAMGRIYELDEEAHEDARAWYEKALDAKPECAHALAGIASTILNRFFASQTADFFPADAYLPRAASARSMS